MTLNTALLITLAVGVLIIAWLTDNNYQVGIQRDKCLTRTYKRWIWKGIIHARIGKVLITLWKEEQ